jgi:hypothetical protein
MFTDFDAEWFQAFRKAVLENEPDLACWYAEEALGIISERFRAPDVSEAEREAMSGAIRSLNVIKSKGCQIAA